MSYRHGLQRIFAVFTVAWIGLVCFGILSGSWKPWIQPVFNRWSSTDEHAPLTIVKSEPLPVDTGTKKNQDAVKFTISPEEFLRQAEERERRITMWSWMAGMATLPPLLAYCCV